ncbi:MAG: AAA family ATPase [Phycisphaerales bacterium]|nr:AAA family ATPase [Phycisphaerales bacterium]
MVKMTSILEQLRPRKWGDMAQGLDHPTVRLLRGYEFGKMPNAILVYGHSGAGKTSAARLFARSMVCSGGHAIPLNDPCGECSSCRAILTSLQWSDNRVCEIDCTKGAPADVVNLIKQAVMYQPVFSTTNFRGKIVILDEVHRNEGKLGNRLLKFIEDSKNVIFILMTTEPAMLSEPLKQRCLNVRFEAPPEQEMTRWLERSASIAGIHLDTGVAQDIVRIVGRIPRLAITVMAAANALAKNVVTLDDVEVAKCNIAI